MTETVECASSPCLHGATCHEAENGYECLCLLGFEGMHCEISKCMMCNGREGGREGHAMISWQWWMPVSARI